MSNKFLNIQKLSTYCYEILYNREKLSNNSELLTKNQILTLKSDVYKLQCDDCDFICILVKLVDPFINPILNTKDHFANYK